jgi:hypothetical protein
MADEKVVSFKLKTPRFRVSFPQVWEKKSFNGSNPRYSVVGLFYPKDFTEKEKAQWAAIRAELNKACLEFFKKDLKTMRGVNGFKYPLHRGDEKTYQGYGNPEMIYFSMANSMHGPEILDKKGNRITQENSEEFYPGCWARATVNVFAFDNIGKGVSIGLGNLQKLGDADRFDGFTSAEDDFGDDPVEGFDDNDDDDLVGDDDDLG